VFQESLHERLVLFRSGALLFDTLEKLALGTNICPNFGSHTMFGSELTEGRVGNFFLGILREKSLPE